MKTKIIKQWRTQNGISVMDISISIIILILFIGVISHYSVQSVEHMAQTQLGAIASNYAVQILERTDKLSYDEVNNSLNNTIEQDLKMLDGYNAQIQVTSYNEDDSTKKDIIKIVTVRVSYMYRDKEESISIKKLKIKE